MSSRTTRSADCVCRWWYLAAERIIEMPLCAWRSGWQCSSEAGFCPFADAILALSGRSASAQMQVLPYSKCVTNIPIGSPKKKPEGIFFFAACWYVGNDGRARMPMRPPIEMNSNERMKRRLRSRCGATGCQAECTLSRCGAHDYDCRWRRHEGPSSGASLCCTGIPFHRPRDEISQ